MRDSRSLGVILFFVISGYLIAVLEGAKLIINPAGQTQSQPAGRGFGLTCQGEAEDPDLFTNMKWVGPKGELKEGSSGPVEVSKAGASLLILMFREPTTEDSGAYNCSATYDNIDKLEQGTQLVFYQDITWEDCPVKQALVITTDGKIRCRVSANPPATITWQKDGQPLSDRYTIENDGIKVTGVTEKDKGDFSLRAMVQQTGKFQDRTLKVEVHVPPEIIELDEKQEATEGHEAMMRCQASGFPRPVYSWFDPDQRDLSTVEGHIVDADTGSLVINSVKRQNRGLYTCLAKNPAGDAKRSLDLSVVVKPEIKQFNNITSVQENSATFECRVIGDPMPTVTIRKQGQDRPFTDDDDRVELQRRQEKDESILVLTIRKTMRDDDGLYYCAGENKGAHVERAGHLQIEFSPEMSSTPTSVKTWNGNPVNLTCIAEAIPNATITWSYNGRKIQEDEFYTIYGRSAHSNLQVRPPSDLRGQQTVYGVYKCHAENAHGERYINIELQEARPPTELRGIRESKKTATTITFEFDGPRDDGGLPVRAYVVKYYEENEPYDKPAIQEWSEGFPYVLKNLKPRTTYLLKFAARNEVDVGEWSDERRIQTPAESAPEPPKFITPGGNVSTYPDRFQLRWTVPVANGRKIDYFQLRYFESAKKSGVWHRLGDTVTREIRNWENSPSFEMTRLKANTFYKVEVRAHNDIGFSQDATMVFQTAAGSEQGHHSNSYQSGDAGGISTGAIFAIIVLIVLVVLLVVDVTCYVRYHWGLVFLLKSRICAKPIVDEKAKEAALDDVKGASDTNNGNVKTDANSIPLNEKGDMEKKTRTEVDNPAFDAKDTKGSDDKNKSPKGSKSSIAKDSLV